MLILLFDRLIGCGPPLPVNGFVSELCGGPQETARGGVRRHCLVEEGSEPELETQLTGNAIVVRAAAKSALGGYFSEQNGVCCDVHVSSQC